MLRKLITDILIDKNQFWQEHFWVNESIDRRENNEIDLIYTMSRRNGPYKFVFAMLVAFPWMYIGINMIFLLAVGRIIRVFPFMPVALELIIACFVAASVSWIFYVLWDVPKILTRIVSLKSSQISCDDDSSLWRGVGELRSGSLLSGSSNIAQSACAGRSLRRANKVIISSLYRVPIRWSVEEGEACGHESAVCGTRLVIVAADGSERQTILKLETVLSIDDGSCRSA